MLAGCAHPDMVCHTALVKRHSSAKVVNAISGPSLRLEALINGMELRPHSMKGIRWVWILTGGLD
jgi:hypothetical protein